MTRCKRWVTVPSLHTWNAEHGNSLAVMLFGRGPITEAWHFTKKAAQFELPRIFERIHPECLKMMTEKHELDTRTQPCKRPCLGIETFSNICLKDCVESQNVSPSFASLTTTTKRSRTDGSISVCDKQPRLQEILENSNRDAVHSFYYEINQYLGELHFQRQVRELRNRLAAQQSPSKSSVLCSLLGDRTCMMHPTYLPP